MLLLLWRSSKFNTQLPRWLLWLPRCKRKNVVMVPTSSLLLLENYFLRLKTWSKSDYILLISFLDMSWLLRDQLSYLRSMLHSPFRTILTLNRFLLLSDLPSTQNSANTLLNSPILLLMPVSRLAQETRRTLMLNSLELLKSKVPPWTALMSWRD